MLHEGEQSAVTLFSAWLIIKLEEKQVEGPQRGFWSPQQQPGGDPAGGFLLPPVGPSFPLLLVLPFLPPSFHFLHSSSLIGAVSSLTSFLSLRLLFLHVWILVLAAAPLRSFPPSFCFYPQIFAEKQNIPGASLNKLLSTEPEPLLQCHTRSS